MRRSHAPSARKAVQNRTTTGAVSWGSKENDSHKATGDFSCGAKETTEDVSWGSKKNDSRKATEDFSWGSKGTTGAVSWGSKENNFRNATEDFSWGSKGTTGNVSWGSKENNSRKATEDFSWGSKEMIGSDSWGSNENDFQSNENTIMFNVLWREFTNKKHKTWKGDGTLELSRDGKKAVLKDHTGKYMGSAQKFKLSELKEGYQMNVSGKEIELQEQIVGNKKQIEVRKLQIANRGWGEEEYQPEEKKVKGQFVFRPNLVLPPIPKMRKNVGVRKIEKPSTSAMVAVKVEPQMPTIKQEIANEIKVSPALLQHLRPHQCEGVSFLYNCLLGFQFPGQYGAILADEMGLGKTLQCLTVAHTLLRNGRNTGAERILKRALVITPSSIVATWDNEINKWLNFDRMYAFVVDGKHKLQKYSQQQHIPFVIVSYETFLTNTDDFCQLEFDLLICDEGHRLKNSSTKMYSALRGLNIKRRILLTGTPVQNNLEEFFTLADFVNPGVFGEYTEFRTHFENPIVQSQSPDASDAIQKLASERSSELQEISRKFLLRRSQDINRQYLPKKREFIVFVKPSDLQLLMLRKALEFYETRKNTILKDLTAFQIISLLQKLCNHPSLVACTKAPNLLTRNLERFLPDRSEMGPFDSAKLELVQNLLISTAVERHEKIVIVSNHTKTLDMLQGLCDHLNLKYLRLDGATPGTERNAIVQKFNRTVHESEHTELVFLLSAKAGGMGLNLCGARRLVLYDNDWNPATDAQAMSRIWRDGQHNDVQIYRLITAGTIEERIFQRQVAKLSLGGCLQVGTGSENVKFTVEELEDLFTLQLDFRWCQTHDSIRCKCSGDGKNLNQLLPTESNSKQINELMHWEHYGPPFPLDILQTAHLQDSSESILYLFSQQTNVTA